MSELITDEIFTDGQEDINASNMNGIIGKARVQPDIIATKVASASMDVADQMLILKTDNTLARARFDTIVNSTSSSLPLADTTKNGMLRIVSGKTTDFVDGTNNCQPISNFLPPGVVVDFAGPNIPAGWLICDGSSYLQSSYPGLWAAIGGYYGSDATHFNVPNFVGRIAAGAGGNFGALAATGGAGSVALATGNLPSHAHPITDVAHSHSASDSGHTHPVTGTIGGASGVASGGTVYSVVANNTGIGHAVISVSASGTGLSATQAVGSGVAFGILPPYLTVYKIIKT